jgi:type I restriction enzyme S subunit
MGEIFAHERIGNIKMDRVPMSDREIDLFAVRAGDLLFARQSLVAAGAGKCALVRCTAETTTFESHLIRVRLDQYKADPEFFHYYFLSPLGKANVQSLVMQVAAAGIRGSELATLQVPVPPLTIQRRITSILSTYDDLIENSQRRIKILEEMARRLYREWFVYFRYPGHEDCRLVESSLGKIPEGWEVKGLGRVAEITMGLSPKGDTYNEDGLGVPLVNGPVEFDERFTKAIKWTTSPTKVCRQGDLVICVRGSTTGKYVKSDGAYCLGRGVASLSGDSQSFIDQLYVDQLPILLRQASGSTFPSWTAPQLSEHPVVCPPPGILSAFERQASPVNELIYQYSSSIQNLRRTRDLLLPRLLSGQIDVEALPDPSATANVLPEAAESLNGFP